MGGNKVHNPGQSGRRSECISVEREGHVRAATVASVNEAIRNTATLARHQDLLMT